MDKGDDIIDEARSAASLPVGTYVRCAGSFGIRWGQIVEYDAPTDTYAIIDEDGHAHDGIDVDHIIDLL